MQSHAKIISANTLNLYRRIKTLFKESRGSLGNREMVKKLRKEGFEVGRYKIRSIMKSLGLKAEQRQAYKVTTKRKHSDTVADNLLN
jgi:putative transposase